MTTPRMEADLGAFAALAVELRANTAALNRAEERRRQIAASVTTFDGPAIEFKAAALPYATPANQYGPKDGYVWAIQRMTVFGLGATTDFINAYKGSSTADVAGQNALNTFTVPIVGAVSTWGPGRTGCILKAKQSLVFQGTFTGADCFVSTEVIQLTLDQLRYFLL